MPLCKVPRTLKVTQSQKRSTAGKATPVQPEAAPHPDDQGDNEGTFLQYFCAFKKKLKFQSYTLFPGLSSVRQSLFPAAEPLGPLPAADLVSPKLNLHVPPPAFCMVS